MFFCYNVGRLYYGRLLFIVFTCAIGEADESVTGFENFIFLLFSILNVYLTNASFKIDLKLKQF